MRIAFPTTEYVTEANYAGGLANYLSRVTAALGELGHEPHVVVLADRTDSFASNGIQIHRISRRRSARMVRLIRSGSSHKDAWASYSVNAALRRLNDEHRFDIIQYPSYRALGLHRLRDVPSVVRISSHRALWQTAQDGSAGTRDRRAEILERKALLGADALYGPSRLLSEVVSEDTNRAVEVLEPPFSVETTKEEESLAENLGQAPFLLFFGTLSALKGIGTIIRALPDLLSLDPRLRLVCIGKDGSLSGGSAVEALKSAAGSSAERVIVHEPVSHALLYPVIRGAEAVILPSLVDNLPNACLEAMGLGQIVVGTRGASFEQLITEGENGILCEIDDADSLRAAVKRALSLSAQERERMKEAARARIAQLSPERCGTQLVEFYRGVIEGSRLHETGAGSVLP